MMSIDWRDARVQCWYALIGRLIPIYLKKSVRPYPTRYAGVKGGRYGLVKFPNEINELRWVLHFPQISVLCIHGRRERNINPGGQAGMVQFRT